MSDDQDPHEPCTLFVSGLIVMTTQPTGELSGVQVRLSEKITKDKAATLGAQLIAYARDGSEIVKIIHDANRRINNGECDTDDLIGWFQDLAKLCGWDKPEEI